MPGVGEHFGAPSAAWGCLVRKRRFPHIGCPQDQLSGGARAGAPQLALRSCEFLLELPGWKATVSTHALHTEAAILRPTCTIPPLTSSTDVFLTIFGPPFLHRFLVEKRRLATHYFYSARRFSSLRSCKIRRCFS